MFGLGWGEVVVIGIVALIAIGPKELPTVLRTLGQWMGKVRRMANEFQGQFNEALREAEFADLKKHADDITSSVNEIGNIDPIGDVAKDVEREFANVDPMAETKPAGTTDGAALPDGILPTSDAQPLPQIDVPLPPVPAMVTEKDFAPTKSARVKSSAGKSSPAKPSSVKARAKKPAKKTGSRA
jgi:sec-independent protein translocase protein TatB